MTIRDTIRRAGRSLRQAKARTLLTSLAISVGAFTVTVALAAGAGGQAYTNDLIKNNGDANSLSVFAQTDQDDSAPKEYGEGSKASDPGMLNDDDLKTIKAIDNVDEVTPLYNISATYMTRDATSKKYETTVNIKADRTEIPLAAGTLKNNEVGKGDVVVAEEYLESLGFKSAAEAIGKTITVRFEKPSLVPGQKAETLDKTFKIVAVNKKTSTVLRYEEALTISTADGKSIHDFQSAGQAKNNSYYGVTVRVAENADVKATQTAIENAGYTVFSLQDLQTALFQFIDVVQYGAAGFGFLAILASIFGIINTQYISVLERTQQIGLMKALGARRKDVGRLFRYEAAWVGFLGGIIGTGLALLTNLLNPWIASSMELEKGTELLKFEPLTSVILVVSLMVIAVVAGYFPARKAAKLDPIEALRTE